MKLNLGGGPVRAAGWVSVDLEGGEVRGDAGRLPFRSSSFSGCFANHSLCAIPTDELPAVVAEVRRVLEPGAIFRVSVPDIIQAFYAMEGGNRQWFPNYRREERRSARELLCDYVTWFSTNRTCFCWDSLERLLLSSFEHSIRCSFSTSVGDEGVEELDDRKPESLFMEAW